MWSVRGIGRRREGEHVDLEAQTGAATPSGQRRNRCSSSTTTRAEVFRDHVTRQDPVRPRSATSTFPSPYSTSTRLTSAGRRKREIHLDAHGESRGNDPWKRVPVLLCEAPSFGTSISTCLPATATGERGAQARPRSCRKPTSAADEPVHRVRRLEVLLHRFDRRAPGPPSRGRGTRLPAARAIPGPRSYEIPGCVCRWA